MIILANGKTSEVSQRTDATGALWVRLGELSGATGWQMKPQGACLGELCVPLPVDRREEWIADAEGWVWFCYSDFADMVGQRHVRDGDVWSLGSVPEVRRVGLENAIAPDFEVAERNGNMTTIRFGLGKVRIGDNAFAQATRDWIERGADSEHVWSTMELAERLKPVDDDTLLAEATFKLALHFEATGDSERARRHFAAAEHLAPDNWNYLRQGWTHKGTAYAYMKVLTRTNDLRKNSDKSYYDPMGLPGENHHRFTEPEWLWTPAVRRLKQLLRR